MQPESGRPTSTPKPGDATRERILETASGLFYREGVRAVGVDLVVEAADVAKTSLYRHFRTKDDLVAAFLKREDEDFWRTWDEVADRHRDDPAGELAAHMDWIGERVGRPHYRGCPQLNVAAEFPRPSTRPGWSPPPTRPNCGTGWRTSRGGWASPARNPWPDSWRS